MRDDAVKYHGIKKEKIDIIGVPQYELYRKMKKKINTVLFKKRIGVKKNQKIICYTCCAERVFPDEELFIEQLLDRIEKGDFGNSILLLRLHPSERKNYYLKKYENADKPIIINYPDSTFSANPTITEIDPSGVENFLSLILSSDVIINHSSTISLDS